LWRAWHPRCDVIHDNGKESIKNSVSFLLNYDAMLTDCSLATSNDKGKKSIDIPERAIHYGFPPKQNARIASFFMDHFY
jgi:hypothetical protein